ncbi:hypothetical protein KEM52_004649, partial [Ascosphaera acerosa]
MEEQARMMAQLMPGFVPPAINPNFRPQQHQHQQQQQQRGRSLFERTEFRKPRRGARDREVPQQQQTTYASEMEVDTHTTHSHSQTQPHVQAADGIDKSAALAPSTKFTEPLDTSTPDNGSAAPGVCKYNLSCRDADCALAHQSPAAPLGAPVDAGDACAFGAACTNRKCAGAHPSPARRAAHQAAELCRFFPHCANPRCRFRHPDVPMCRNGADCAVPNCAFTHLTLACKFAPCLNPQCP